MATVFNNVANYLTNYVKGKVKLHSLRKEDLQAVLRDSIELHLKIEKALSQFGAKDLRDWYANLKPVLKKRGGKIDSAFDVYVSQLRGKAASFEREYPFKSIQKANDAYAKLLEEISKKIDTILEADKVDIYNVRLSTLAVLGIIKQSDRVANFSIYLYAYLMRVSSHSAASIPKYREKYILDHLQTVTLAISNILDKKGSYLFLREMNDLRNNQRDLVVGATGQFDFHHFAIVKGFSVSFLDNILGALGSLNIFGAAWDAWDDYRQDKYERNKEIKEWLEQHNALLRMDLANMDPTSPEYQKTLNIIKAYDDKIAEYDRAIMEFEQED